MEKKVGEEEEERVGEEENIDFYLRNFIPVF